MPRVRFITTFFPLLLLLLPACAAPSPSPLPTVTSSPFPLFIPSPLPLFTPTPSLPLHAPDPATLVRVLNYGIGLERDAWETFDYPTFHGDFLTSPEARGLFDFVQADLERYYPNGLPHAETLFTDGTLDPNIWFPPRAVWLLAQTAVVNLLRESQSTLTENTPLLLFSSSPSPLFSLTPTSHELDGDPTPEWLVEVISEPYNLHGWIPLDETVDGYTLIPNDIQHENLARGENTTFQFTPDLNGDGLDDLVMHFDGQALGTQFGELRVYGRHEGKIVWLGQIGLGPGVTYAIGNFDQDNSTEIRQTIQAFLNFECEWSVHKDFQWKSGTLEMAVDALPPDTPFCKAARAIDPTAGFPNANRLELLEESLHQLTLETAPTPDYLALLHVHLAMAYAGQHLDELAKSTLDAVANLPDTPFVSIVRKNWTMADSSPLAFCYALNRAAQQKEIGTTELAPYLSPSAIFQAYGDRLNSEASLICPLNKLIEARLDIEQISSEDNPIDSLKSLGYQLSNAQPINFESRPEFQWLATLDLEQPELLFAELNGTNWKFSRPVIFSGPIERLQYRILEVFSDEDDQSEIVLFATINKPVSTNVFPSCSSKTANEVSIVSFSGVIGYTKKSEGVLCGDISPTDIFTGEDIRELVLDHSLEPPINDLSEFYRNLTDWENQILMEGDIHSARAAISRIQSTVPPDHPTASHLIPRLLFDIGLSYELEGDVESARAAYMDLIAQWPDSPWAWLAEARVGDPQS